MPRAAGGACVTAAYRGYAQAELDAQYDQTTLVPDPGPYIARWTRCSGAVRAAHPPERLRYGAGEREAVDVFRPEGPGPAPLHLHLHGGAWRSLSKEAVSLLAEPLLRRGIAYAAMGFPLAPEATLDAMVACVVAGFDRLVAEGARLGLDGGRIGVSGFSSGAHLAAMLLTHRPGAGSLGATLVSGLYDLEPVRLSARNRYLGLDAAAAARVSPIGLPWPDVPVALFAGDGELAEFRRQTRAMAASLSARGHAATAAEVPDANHFDMFDALYDPGGPVLGSVLARHAAPTIPPRGDPP